MLFCFGVWACKIDFLSQCQRPPHRQMRGEARRPGWTARCFALYFCSQPCHWLPGYISLEKPQHLGSRMEILFGSLQSGAGVAQCLTRHMKPHERGPPRFHVSHRRIADVFFGARTEWVDLACSQKGRHILRTPRPLVSLSGPGSRISRLPFGQLP